MPFRSHNYAGKTSTTCISRVTSLLNPVMSFYLLFILDFSG
nr:MAG TPA: hypothetical protein [Caudoviricetes sp.]